MDCSARRIALTPLIALLFSGSAFLGCSKTETTVTSLPYYNTPDFTPVFIREGEDVASLIHHQIGDFSFTNQENRVISQKDIEGKIHVANFVFTSCISICPKMTNHMAMVRQAFTKDEDLVLLSYSVTPWIDSVGRLKEYAEVNGIDSRNWHLLTGNRSKIYELARRSYFAEEDLGYTRDSTEFLHTEHFILVDKSKRIRGIYNGTLELEIEQLIADIHALKIEE